MMIDVNGAATLENSFSGSLGEPGGVSPWHFSSIESGG